MTVANDAAENAERAASIHREFVQLAFLVAIAVAAFFLTRAVAASNRALNLRNAAEWYHRGQQALEQGHVEDAIDAFRRATIRKRGDKTYLLGLSRALVMRQDFSAARSVLLTLREAAPEDAEVNLELARLSVQRQDVSEAVRFYHSALYAPWTPELAEARRQVRFELIRFLLSHDQDARAVSELLAAASDLPDQPAAHLEVAQLFFQANDFPHALEHFQRVLRLAPAEGSALAGAGRSAFELGNYTQARTYLRRAPADLPDVSTTRALAELVLANDPLANRIGSAERRRRLTSDLRYARERLVGCIAATAADRSVNGRGDLQHELEAFSQNLKPTAALDQDTIESGVDLLDRAAHHFIGTCGPPTPLDRALVLIGQHHKGDTR